MLSSEINSVFQGNSRNLAPGKRGLPPTTPGSNASDQSQCSALLLALRSVWALCSVLFALCSPLHSSACVQLNHLPEEREIESLKAVLPNGVLSVSSISAILHVNFAP